MVRQSLAHARPTARAALIGSALWAALMAASAVLSLWLNGWATPRSVLALGLLFAAGGALAFAPALWLAQLLSARRAAEARYAAALLSFAGATLGLTALLYSIQYRLTFQEEHAEAFTKAWAVDIAFTVASASYRFGMFGARLYVPLGVVALFFIAFWHARRPR